MAGIEIELGRVLDDYSKEVREDAERVIEQVAKETVKRLRKTSPKDTGAYARGWRLKNDRRGLTATVYNATHPGLTHLLEEQHPIANQFGTYGVSTPQEHIGPAERWAIGEIDRRIEEVFDQ